jgi:hypothetical protein
MNIIIKQLIICLIVFIVFSYIQKYQDKINKVTYKNIYDEYKIPLFISLVVGLILNLHINGDIDYFIGLFVTDTTLILDKSELPSPATIHDVKTNPIKIELQLEHSDKKIHINNEENIYTHLPTF